MVEGIALYLSTLQEDFDILYNFTQQVIFYDIISIQSTLLTLKFQICKLN